MNMKCAIQISIKKEYASQLSHKHSFIIAIEQHYIII